MCRSERSRAILIFSVLALCAGCVQEMANQPRLEPLEASTVFDDGRSSRQSVPGTIARGQLQLDSAFYTGREGDQLYAGVAVFKPREDDGRIESAGVGEDDLLRCGFFGHGCSSC